MKCEKLEAPGFRGPLLVLSLSVGSSTRFYRDSEVGKGWQDSMVFRQWVETNCASGIAWVQ